MTDNITLPRAVAPLACSGDVAGDHDDPLDERFEVEPDEETLHADGFEDALVGYGQQFNRLLAVYDYAKCVEILIDRDGMSDDQAEEWMSCNVTGGWHGEYTPVFLIPNTRL